MAVAKGLLSVHGLAPPADSVMPTALHYLYAPTAFFPRVMSNPAAYPLVQPRVAHVLVPDIKLRAPIPATEGSKHIEIILVSHRMRFCVKPKKIEDESEDTR
ncbi:hypothetical protein Fot_10985 [Forsythia ovata]|uniref:Uncharacterized protein n=1 Tax=Forsythia ovata TaxID=205694 RepID=A0ABD1WM41_9LAMI